MSQAFSFRHRLRSFGYAWSGLSAVLRTEHNSRIHLALTTVALFLGLWLRLSALEWASLIIVFALVWMAELFNTVFELLADLYTTKTHPQIKAIKDVSAAGVLVSACAAFATGCVLFIPKIIALT